MGQEIQVLVYRPNHNGEKIVFEMNEALLENAIALRNTERQKMLESYKSIYSNTDEKIDDEKLQNLVDNYFQHDTIQIICDSYIHTELCNIIGSKYTDTFTLYRPSSGEHFLKISALIGDTSAIDQKDTPNRQFFGTFIVVKYSTDGFIISLNHEDIVKTRKEFDIY